MCSFLPRPIGCKVGGDRGVMSTNLVKYWTLLLILGAVGAWTYYIVEGRKHTGVLSAVLILGGVLDFPEERKMIGFSQLGAFFTNFFGGRVPLLN